MDEGYIKFKCRWIKTNPVPLERLLEINKWRNKLYDLGLIGVYDNGIGFGNISIRAKNNFIITGSATGNLKRLNENHYSLVKKYNFMENSLTCEGPVKASSESLSHAAVYESSPETNAVIHIHNPEMWKKSLGKLPTTSKNAEYGTPEMADEIKRLFAETDVNKKKILVMGGHKEGIISFGKDLNEAGSILLRKFKEK